MPRLVKRRRNQITSCAAALRETYSASVEDFATVACFRLRHVIRAAESGYRGYRRYRAATQTSDQLTYLYNNFPVVFLLFTHCSHIHLFISGQNIIMGLHSTENSQFKPEEISQKKTKTKSDTITATHQDTHVQTPKHRKSDKNSATQIQKETNTYTNTHSFYLTHVWTDTDTQAHRSTKPDSLTHQSHPQTISG